MSKATTKSTQSPVRNHETVSGPPWPSLRLWPHVPTSGRASGVAEPPAGTVSRGGAVKRRSRLALPTTDRELAAMATAAMIGDRSQPVKG